MFKNGFAEQLDVYTDGGELRAWQDHLRQSEIL